VLDHYLPHPIHSTTFCSVSAKQFVTQIVSGNSGNKRDS